MYFSNMEREAILQYLQWHPGKQQEVSLEWNDNKIWWQLLVYTELTKTAVPSLKVAHVPVVVQSVAQI